MTTKHTPTPYGISKYGSIVHYTDTNYPQGVAFATMTRSGTRGQGRVDAEFIVRACNNHDALLAALEHALALVTAADLGPSAKPAIAQYRAAIAAAKGA